MLNAANMAKFIQVCKEELAACPEGTPERVALEKEVALVLIGAAAHAIQCDLELDPFPMIIAMRELANVGEGKCRERGAWPVPSQTSSHLYN